MIKLWTLVLGLITMIAVMPAEAGAGCGSCPADKAKASSEKKACPTGCQKECCKSGSSKDAHAHGAEDGHAGHGHEGHSH